MITMASQHNYIVGCRIICNAQLRCYKVVVVVILSLNIATAPSEIRTHA